MTTLFYHIKNLQSTKTYFIMTMYECSFITLRIYKVLKLHGVQLQGHAVLSH